MGLQMRQMRDEITVVRAQAASHADMALIDESYRHVSQRLGDVEFNISGISGEIVTLKARKDEVTTADMVEFSGNLSAVLSEFDKRLAPLEQDLIKRQTHY